MKLTGFLALLVPFMFFICCSSTVSEMTNPTGQTIKTRIKSPKGYQWVSQEPGSFADFITNLPLKSQGAKILDFRGNPISNQSEHVAILDIDVGSKDLQQCADAVIRVRAEYLWAQKKYNEIGFHFTSGDFYSWNQYRSGYIPKISGGNRVEFVQRDSKANTYQNLKKYLEIIFAYAGSISLNTETKIVGKDSQIKIGDILIAPGSPGHVVFICGKAKDKNNNYVYLLAEGYTPAQSIHIITNPYDSKINPWYKLSISESSKTTARYTFSKVNIRSY